MPLDLHDCRFSGPALPEPFVAFELERELASRKLLPPSHGKAGDGLQQSWEPYRRKLRDLVTRGGALRVFNHVLEPLAPRLGFTGAEDAAPVTTREGVEDGGTLFTFDGQRLRTWAVDFEADLDAPSRRGHAYRYSPIRCAQRVLVASQERAGLVTNGIELRLLLADPARPDSQVEVAIDPSWRTSRDVPDSYRLIQALACPRGLVAIPEIVEAARLQQTRVTKELRRQAREAVELFVQDVLDLPANATVLAAWPDRRLLAGTLWHEGLVLVYRLLFCLKLESTDDPARAFTFASTSLWRNTFSPSTVLARLARRILDEGLDTGRMLEDGLRTLFRLFAGGVACSELNIHPLGGQLFGPASTPLLESLPRWGERACAHLLAKLLWTPPQRGGHAPLRVHYGPLDVEDLGRVYEALLELEPGIAAEPMCRLRRQKLEVVVPAAQGERYREAGDRGTGTGDTGQGSGVRDQGSGDRGPGEEAEEDGEAAVDEDGEETPARGKKTRVEWIEEIPPDRFYLRVGLGRKASGSYYTPDSFVRFLVQETLGPQVAARSPKESPNPAAILALKVADIAVGSGHFLVQADRFLGAALYEACRLCDEKAMEAEARAERAAPKAERAAALAEAESWRRRVVDLPDPNDELMAYLPSRVAEGTESGVSQRKAEALCRRLVAVHCLYGVDKNPLAVELTKLSLWIECHAEGLPLTFLDHRIVAGDSITGPFFEHMLKAPGTGKPLEDLFARGLTAKLTTALGEALVHVRDLEASVGVSLADLEAKRAAKERLDRALAPFRILAAAWAGGVMLGGPGAGGRGLGAGNDRPTCDDGAYRELARHVAATGELPHDLAGEPRLLAMIARGLGVENVPGLRHELLALVASGRYVPALPFELTFPEVFFPGGDISRRQGFHGVLGNPPWDAIQFKTKEFFAGFDFEILNAPTKRERTSIENRLLDDEPRKALFEKYQEDFEQVKRANDVLYEYQKVQVEGDLAGRQLDLFRVFMERNAQLLQPDGLTGVLVPSAFHGNEGATGVRRLYLEHMGLKCCYSFENRRKLFEIHSSFKFALVVASRRGPTTEFPCAFYLHDEEWLFRAHDVLTLTVPLVHSLTANYLALPELRTIDDLRIVRWLVGHSTSWIARWPRLVRFRTTELHKTHDSDLFEAALSAFPDGSDPRRRGQEHGPAAWLLLVEGKTFHQFGDLWGEPPRYAVRTVRLLDRPSILRAAQHYRLAYRGVTHATNERTVIACILPPGRVFGHNEPPEIAPWERPSCNALELSAVANSFSLDFQARVMASSYLTNFVLRRLPYPEIPRLGVALLVHHALRLTCNHAGYEPLWREQLGDTWREPKAPSTWPVLEGDDERWAVRAAIDAVVAEAYGLDREQYEHVLSTFSHRSYPRAPELCLAAFDELKEIGLDAFTKKHDPYWDIPLNESLPQPVIDLPIPEEAGSGVRGQGSGERRGRGLPGVPGAGRGADARADRRETADERVLRPFPTQPALPFDAGFARAAEPPSPPYSADFPALPAARLDPDTYELIRMLLDDRGVIASTDAQALTGLAAAAVRPYLQRLVTDGLAAPEGQRRGLRYRATRREP